MQLAAAGDDGIIRVLLAKDGKVMDGPQHQQHHMSSSSNNTKQQEQQMQQQSRSEINDALELCMLLLPCTRMHSKQPTCNTARKQC